MRPYPFKTLRARLTVLMISPVVLILLVAGVSGFIYARDVMIDQWNESVMLKLGQAAHEIDMRLSKPVEMMEMFSKSGTGTPNVSLLETIVRELETLPGVVRANVNWHFSATGHKRLEDRHAIMGHGRFMLFHRGAFTKIAPPKVDEDSGEQMIHHHGPLGQLRYAGGQPGNHH